MGKRFGGFPEEGLRFLRALGRNNRREWFNERKAVYEDTLKRPMAEFIEALAVEFRGFAPEFVANPKVSAYRIYRDTRFSPNKAPYKTHVAAVFPRRGVGKHEGAGFYVHVAPGEVFAGGGLYMLSPQDLQAVREQIAADPGRLRRIIRARRFREYFGELGGERLTRIPRGFPRDHPAVDLLRHRQFLAGRELDESLATTARFLPEVVRTFKALLPLVRLLNEPIVGRRERADLPG